MSTLYVDNLQPNLGSRVMAAGHVVQVVQQTYGVQINTSSTSYVTSNLAASITPTSTNSKILINVNACVYAPAGNYIFATVYRGSTNLAPLAVGGGEDAFIAASETDSMWSMGAINYLDSPSTTSSTTYTLYYKASAGTAYIHNGYTVSTITLMEIAQ